MSISKQKLETIINTRLAPLLAVDDADIELISIIDEQSLVRVRFGGRYHGAPCRDIVLKYVVEPVLKSEIEQIERIEWID